VVNVEAATTSMAWVESARRQPWRSPSAENAGSAGSADTDGRGAAVQDGMDMHVHDRGLVGDGVAAGAGLGTQVPGSAGLITDVSRITTVPRCWLGAD
jgi:hypothetical protein